MEFSDLWVKVAWPESGISDFQANKNFAAHNKRKKRTDKACDNMSVYEINQFAFKYLKEFEVSPCNGKPREKKYRIPNNMKEYLRIYQCV